VFAREQLHVGVIVHSLRHNNIGRVYPFLRAFEGCDGVRFTLAGWSGDELFPLLRALPWPIVRLSGSPTDARARAALDAALGGCDLLHCFKNRAHLRTALQVAQARGLPLALDLDDWELGLYLEGVAGWPRWRQALWGPSIAGRVREGLALEELGRTAPAAVLVNSTALRALFGGEIAYTAADEAQFDPAHADGPGFRRRVGLPAGAPVVGFLGTPHRHKGIDTLLAAFAELRARRSEARLLLVGVPGHNPYRARLGATPGVVVAGYLGADEYPHAYAACDAIAIPQRPVIEGIMQTPAKLILAMAAGKAIVATRVGDIPAVLDDAGVLVPPDAPAALADELDALLASPERRAALGAAARARFLERNTLQQLREQMLAVYERLRASAQAPR
jgi:glycosyltransferase involved in cell wall biosynthesis